MPPAPTGLRAAPAASGKGVTTEYGQVGDADIRERNIKEGEDAVAAVAAVAADRDAEKDHGDANVSENARDVQEND